MQEIQRFSQNLWYYARNSRVSAKPLILCKKFKGLSENVAHSCIFAKGSFKIFNIMQEIQYSELAPEILRSFKNQGFKDSLRFSKEFKEFSRIQGFLMVLQRFCENLWISWIISKVSLKPLTFLHTIKDFAKIVEFLVFSLPILTSSNMTFKELAKIQKKQWFSQNLWYYVRNSRVSAKPLILCRKFNVFAKSL